MVMNPLIVASYCKLLTSSNNNHLASTATFLRDLDTRLDSLEKEAVEQLIQQLQEVLYRLMLFIEIMLNGEEGERQKQTFIGDRKWRNKREQVSGKGRGEKHF
jgi:hypothetical protein